MHTFRRSPASSPLWKGASVRIRGANGVFHPRRGTRPVRRGCWSDNHTVEERMQPSHSRCPDARIETLRQRHVALDHAIAAREAATRTDDPAVKRLKAEKLALKDEIDRLNRD